MAGALHYADVKSGIVIRCFAPSKEPAADAAEIANWGADGILADLIDDDLETVLGALNHPIPIVNFPAIKKHAGVVKLTADFQYFVETGVTHLRQVGLHSFAMFVALEGAHIRERLFDKFLRIVHSPSALGDNLILQIEVEREKLMNPHGAVVSVPVALADWLRSLPKPTGVLCPIPGSGGYLIRCCKALGLRVPEDFAVIGADDTDFSVVCEPTLTSIMPAFDKLGFEGARILCDMIAGKWPKDSDVRLTRIMDLQVRESTGARKPEICDIAGALKYIHENACRGLTVERLIKETQHVSKMTFHQRFQEVVGKSPHEAIRDRKLEEVRRLLITTELPITMVSDLSGFGNPKVLAEVFRAAEGVTMRDFRKTRKIPAA